MPPRKKQKTALEFGFAHFIEGAMTQFSKHQKNGRITLFKLRQICASLGLELDESLLSAQDDDGIEQDRFEELAGQLKRESELSSLADYVYEYLAYGSEEPQVTMESFARALKTLPRQPKRPSTISNMYMFANNSTVKTPISKDAFLRLLRKCAFFDKHYQEFNVNSSFTTSNKDEL